MQRNEKLYIASASASLVLPTWLGGTPRQWFKEAYRLKKGLAFSVFDDNDITWDHFEFPHLSNAWHPPGLNIAVRIYVRGSSVLPFDYDAYKILKESLLENFIYYITSFFVRHLTVTHSPPTPYFPFDLGFLRTDETAP
jgi:hypothetical protein